MPNTAKVTPIKPAGFVIETGVPLEGGKVRTGHTAIFRELAAAPVGASVFFPGLRISQVCPPRELTPTGPWLSMRTVEGGVRVWKIAEPKSR